MRIGEYGCDEVCEGCEKENEPEWCLNAFYHLLGEILEEILARKTINIENDRYR